MSNSEINRTLRNIKDARKHFQSILNNPNATEDQKMNAEWDLSSIEELIDAMCKYTSSVFDDNFKNATRTIASQMFNDVKEYQDNSESVERTRKMTHNDLIIKVKVAGIVCENAGLPLICDLLPQEFRRNTEFLMKEENRGKVTQNGQKVVEIRHAIADWAWDITVGCAVPDIDKYSYQDNREDFEEVSKAISSSREGLKKTMKDITNPEL